ncbi:acyltransferase [Brachybacterium sp. DNPG3]
MTQPDDASQRSPETSTSDDVEDMKARILLLEREVRYLRHHLEQSDPAGRPPFRTPDFVTIGEGSRVGRGVTMSATERTPISIGSRTRILRGAEILGPTSIGDRVFLNRDVYVRAQVTIGDGVSIGPFTRLISDSHDVGDPEHRAGQGKTEPIVVGEGAWIGAGVTILGGVTIGSGAVIAAGAVVTSDVAANTIVGGIPARLLRSIEG